MAEKPNEQITTKRLVKTLDGLTRHQQLFALAGAALSIGEQEVAALAFSRLADELKKGGTPQ